MNEKINLGEVSVAEFNVIMAQLSQGRLADCIDLFMRFRQIAEAFQQTQANAPRDVPPPKRATAE